jgi:hypothetical protein
MSVLSNRRTRSRLTLGVRKVFSLKS